MPLLDQVRVPNLNKIRIANSRSAAVHTIGNNPRYIVAMHNAEYERFLLGEAS